jgi:hypothetical protein
MPAMASFTIPDGEDTPVDHIFNPAFVGGANGVAGWIEQASSPYLIGKNFVRVTRTLPPGGAANRSVRVLLGMPLLRDVPVGGVTSQGYTPGPVVDSTLYFDGKFVLPLNASEQSFENLRVLAGFLISSVSHVRLAVEAGETSW